VATDGAAVYHLIERCPPLDTNSRYCNLLQCTHFADTAIVAERNGEMVGFVSGYVDPRRTDTLFVWQVAVDPECRGQRLATRMLTKLLERESCRGVRYLTTSITPDNTASQRTFRALADALDANLTTTPWLSSQRHFEGCHDPEDLIRIGPFTRPTTTRDIARAEAPA
jgi:L-2,4-diaminobutyric acid acetyltransferase